VIVPLRAPPPFAAALKTTVPLPAPDDPPVTVIQAAFDTAVHVQPPPALTQVPSTSGAPTGPPALALHWSNTQSSPATLLHVASFAAGVPATQLFAAIFSTTLADPS
jgi:hypothetical protein